MTSSKDSSIVFESEQLGQGWNDQHYPNKIAFFFRKRMCNVNIEQTGKETPFNSWFFFTFFTLNIKSSFSQPNHIPNPHLNGSSRCNPNFKVNSNSDL